MITVTHCGHDSHHLNACDIEHKEGIPEYLFLLIKTNCWFVIDQQLQPVSPNTAILFDKNVYIHYGCDQRDYNDDWIHFDTSGMDLGLLDSLEIPRNQLFSLPTASALSPYIQSMTTVYRTPSAHAPEIMDALMRAFLYALSDERLRLADSIEHHKYYAAFGRLRTELYNTPSRAWTVKGMADSLYLSLSYFQHLYQEFFRCSCRQDIIRARLDLAKLYLCTSNMSIRNLAEFCGYGNELHFMRQFKKQEGLTPSEYRKFHKPSSCKHLI